MNQHIFAAQLDHDIFIKLTEWILNEANVESNELSVGRNKSAGDRSALSLRLLLLGVSHTLQGGLVTSRSDEGGRGRSRRSAETTISLVFPVRSRALGVPQINRPKDGRSGVRVRTRASSAVRSQRPTALTPMNERAAG
jgi:hypothetical protein